MWPFLKKQCDHEYTLKSWEFNQIKANAKYRIQCDKCSQAALVNILDPILMCQELGHDNNIISNGNGSIRVFCKRCGIKKNYVLEKSE